MQISKDIRRRTKNFKLFLDTGDRSGMANNNPGEKRTGQIILGTVIIGDDGTIVFQNLCLERLKSRTKMVEMNRSEQNANVFYLNICGELYRILDILRDGSVRYTAMHSIIKEYDDIMKKAQRIWDEENPSWFGLFKRKREEEDIPSKKQRCV